MSDPHSAYVTLLLHCDGTNGAAGFVDSSGAPLTVTANGTAVHSTSSPKFGTACAIFDGTSGCYLSVPANTGFDFGSGDFTIEFQIRPDDVYITDQDILAQMTTGNLATLSFFFAITGGYVSCGVRDGTNTFSVDFGLTDLSSASFKHLAMVRASNTLTVYLDGVVKGSTSVTTSVTASSSALMIGKGLGDGEFFGEIDELRITKGVARYTAAFTPPSAAFDDPVAGAISATAALTGPSPTLAFTASRVASIAASLTAPSPSVAIYGGANAALVGPRPRLYFEAHDATGERSALLTAPSPALTFFGGANADVEAPSAALVSAGTAEIMARVAAQAPSPTLSSAGMTSSLANASIRPPPPNLVGYGGAVISVSVTGRPTVQASGITGASAQAALTCPLFQLMASSTAQIHGSADLIAPSPALGATIQAWLVAPGARLTAIGSAVVTATYEAYAVNLKHDAESVDEVTRYTNFPFTHIVRHKNSYYGVSPSGLYLLEGTTDAGTAIAWSIKTAMTDFDSPKLKRVECAYFTGRIGAATTITAYPGEDAPNGYSYSTPRGVNVQNHRQKFGLGMKGTFFAIGMQGSDAIALDNIELNVIKLSRRI